MAELILGIGGNQGDRLRNMLMAGGLLTDRLGRIVEFSSIVESEAWGYQSENKFLNQIIIIETSLTAEKILEICLDTEAKLGRERSDGYVDRTIDVDILFYDDHVCSEDKLTIPHPRLHERLFILKPLAQLRPKLVHPLKGISVEEMLKDCKDSTVTNWFNTN